jgi:hypothetical protein
MKEKTHVSSTQSNTVFSTGFAFGNLYKTIKEELNSIGAASGGSFTPISLARRLARLLNSEEVRGELGSSERVLQVQVHSTGLPETTSAQSSHVRTHEHRALSKKARKNISIAQKARWAKIREEKTLGVDKPKPRISGWPKSVAGRKIEMASRRKQAKRNKEAKAA